jgi:hypothetical protein
LGPGGAHVAVGVLAFVIVAAIAEGALERIADQYG